MNTISNLLAYYVTGKATGKCPYTATVCKILKVQPTTPMAALLDEIPALAQAIAKCEGYGKPNDAGTHLNNPGNILFAHQPNAVAYKDANGYTYAKFTTLQDGWNALEGLLTRMIENVFKIKGPTIN